MELKALWIVGLLLLFAPDMVTDDFTIKLPDQTSVKVQYSDYSLPGLSMIDFSKLDQLMDQLDRKLYKPATNARINANNRIVGEQPGQQLNRRLFTEQIIRIYEEMRTTEALEAPVEVIYPKVDSETLASIREKPVGYYVTYYNSRNKNRSHNIALAAEAINNTVVFPGELFSFNKVVGMRTKERGYQQAPIIVRGELAEGIGGGICQVSSTLYNAVDRAGVQIVERYSHSKRVPYVLAGRDATVSWNGPDFSFHNPYNQPLLIRAFATGGRMLVTVYSSDVIEYKPREVPGISARQLPEEISITAPGHE